MATGVLSFSVHMTSVFSMQGIMNYFFGKVITCFLQIEHKLSLPVKAAGIW